MSKETIVFGGGCFWCTEAVFKMLKGVISVEPGYSGGSTVNPTYEEVCAGTTGHAECTKVEYNPDEVSLDDLLTVFFGSHDPTTINRQGADIGSQYRSIIFYATADQKEEILKFIKNINISDFGGKNIVTEVEPLKEFYLAENYHKNYYVRNKNAPYCEIVINPKLEKVVKNFAKLLNDKSKHKNE